LSTGFTSYSKLINVGTTAFAVAQLAYPDVLPAVLVLYM